MEKKSFRKRCFEKMKRRMKRSTYAQDKKIVKHLYVALKQKRAQTIMLYLPLKSEVNIFPLLRRLRQEKRMLYVPFMEGKSFRLVKYRLPLENKQFGIKEPKKSNQYRKKQIDIAIVPIVGMDVTQRRIGFGKGMYDRFFEKEKQHISQVWFVSRGLCYSSVKVTDHYDVKADAIYV
jgi:5-formyltetrahydrofolate cyclo-ligase